MDGWMNENKKLKILPFSVAVSTPESFLGLGRGSYKYGGVRVEKEHTWRSVISSSSLAQKRRRMWQSYYGKYKALILETKPGSAQLTRYNQCRRKVRQA